MDVRLNALGQPVGVDLPDWRPVPRPPGSAMDGKRCRVEPLDPARHGADLFDAFAEDRAGRNFTYLSAGPFADRAAFDGWIDKTCLGADPMFHAIVERSSGRALGLAAFMRIDPAVGVIEVGHINFSPELQRSAMATEAMYLMMRRVFEELGYRRYEWKCDALNAPSRRAALRFGFTYEGLFRQATIYRGRSRDTAWFSMLDSEWPAIRSAYEVWLAEDNFDPDGRQRVPLGVLIGRLRS